MKETIHLLAFYGVCCLFGVIGWFLAAWIGWDIVLLLKTGTTSPDWVLSSMDHEAERLADLLIRCIGGLLGFAWSSAIICGGVIKVALNSISIDVE